MFQVIERSLPADLRLDFKSRYCEGYNLQEETHKWALWKIYKGSKDLLSRDTGLSNITSEPAAPELPRPSAETPVPANDTADEEIS